MPFVEIKHRWRCLDCGKTFWTDDDWEENCPECGSSSFEWIDTDQKEFYTHGEMYRETNPE